MYDADDRWHRRVLDLVTAANEPIIVPVVILAELDYLLNSRLGIDAELELLQNIADGSLMIEPFTASDVIRSRQLIDQYRSLDLGLADAAVVATAERLNIHKILTVDERDFRVIRTARGKAFTLLPADSTKKPRGYLQDSPGAGGSKATAKLS